MYITKHKNKAVQSIICYNTDASYYFPTKKYHDFKQYHGILITLDHTWTYLLPWHYIVLQSDI